MAKQAGELGSGPATRLREVTPIVRPTSTRLIQGGGGGCGCSSSATSVVDSISDTGTANYSPAGTPTPIHGSGGMAKIERVVLAKLKVKKS